MRQPRQLWRAQKRVNAPMPIGSVRKSQVTARAVAVQARGHRATPDRAATTQAVLPGIRASGSGSGSWHPESHEPQQVSRHAAPDARWAAATRVRLHEQ